MILAVDPGDTTGLALFFEDGHESMRWQLGYSETIDWLALRAQDFDITTVLYEDYRLRKGRALQQSGSKLLATRVIGALDLHAAIQGIDIMPLPVDAHIIGSMWSGVKPPSDHSKSHEIDAYNIGIWWLVKNDLIKAPVLA